jgi:GNAT superfamily N-acetyltransferase
VREVQAADGSSFVVALHPDITSWVTFDMVVDKRDGDMYRAHADGKVIGQLQFFRDFPRQGMLGIRTMGVDPDYQRRGVGGALIEKLYTDNPGWRIDPGTTTEAGLALVRRALETEPMVREMINPYYEEKTTGY